VPQTRRKNPRCKTGKKKEVTRKNRKRKAKLSPDHSHASGDKKSEALKGGTEGTLGGKKKTTSGNAANQAKKRRGRHLRGKEGQQHLSDQHRQKNTSLHQ